MASDNGKKYILSDVEDFAKKNSFNDTFKMAKTWEEIGFHVSALSYKGFRVITLSRWGSGVLQLFFNGDTFLKTRYSLGTIHYAGITQWTKDYIDNPYGIQRIWFNIKNGYQEGDKHHYKEFLKNKNKVHIDENMKKQTIKLNESQLRNIIKESVKKVLNERKPADRQVGPHKFKGTSYDKNGNPRYTCDTVPDEYKKTMGWRMTKKHGLHGQIGDPSKVPGVTNESKLQDIIKESIKKVLKESERREIFTINIFDIENENSIDDMQYARDYKSADEAIQAAREVAQKYADYDSVINVFVMAGEYMDENGDIFGEPDAIYCISNKDKRTTMIARKNAGYSSLESDEYIG